MSHPGDTAKASLGGHVGPFSLDGLAGFCRERGIDRLEVTSEGFGVVMVMGEPLVVPDEPRKEATPEEAARDERFNKLRRMLGRPPTAFEMENLP